MLKRGRSGSFGEDEKDIDPPRSKRPRLDRKGVTVNIPRPVFTSGVERWKCPELSAMTKMLVRGFITNGTPLQRFASNALFERQLMRCVDAFMKPLTRQIWSRHVSDTGEDFQPDQSAFDPTRGEVYLWSRRTDTLLVKSLSDVDRAARTVKFDRPLNNMQLHSAFGGQVVMSGTLLLSSFVSVFNSFDGKRRAFLRCSHAPHAQTAPLHVVFNPRSRRFIVQSGVQLGYFNLCVLDTSAACVAHNIIEACCGDKLHFDQHRNLLWVWNDCTSLSCFNPDTLARLWQANAVSPITGNHVFTPSSFPLRCSNNPFSCAYSTERSWLDYRFHALWSSTDGLVVLASLGPPDCVGRCESRRTAVLTFPVDSSGHVAVDLTCLSSQDNLQLQNVNKPAADYRWRVFPHPCEGAFIAVELDGSPRVVRVTVVPGCF